MSWQQVEAFPAFPTANRRSKRPIVSQSTETKSSNRRHLSLDARGRYPIPVARNDSEDFHIKPQQRLYSRFGRLNCLVARKKRLLEQRKFLVLLKRMNETLANFFDVEQSRLSYLVLDMERCTSEVLACLPGLDQHYVDALIALLRRYYETICFLLTNCSIGSLSIVRSLVSTLNGLRFVFESSSRGQTLESLFAGDLLLGKLAIFLSSKDLDFHLISFDVSKVLMNIVRRHFSVKETTCRSQKDYIMELCRDGESLLETGALDIKSLFCGGNNSRLLDCTGLLRSIVYGDHSLPRQLEMDCIDCVDDLSLAALKYAVSASVWTKINSLIFSHIDLTLLGEMSSGNQSVFLSNLRFKVMEKTFRNAWDSSFINVLGVSSLDKCFQYRVEGRSPPHTTRTTHLMTAILAEQQLVESILLKEKSTLEYTYSYLSLSVAASQFFYRWLLLQLEANLSSWTVAKVLGLIYSDLASVSKTVVKRVLNAHQISDRLRPPIDDTQPQNYASVAFSLSVRGAKVMEELQALYAHMVARLSARFRQMCAKFWRQTFPTNKLWRKRFRNAETEPSDFVTATIFQLIYPFTSSLADFAEEQQTTVLIDVIGTVMTEWETVIFNRKLKLSSSGTDQLKKDVCFLRDWFQPENCAGLSSAVCHRLQTHPSFDQWLRGLDQVSFSSGAGNSRTNGTAISNPAHLARREWSQLKMREKSWTKNFSCSGSASVAISK